MNIKKFGVLPLLEKTKLQKGLKSPTDTWPSQLLSEVASSEVQVSSRWLAIFPKCFCYLFNIHSSRGVFIVIGAMQYSLDLPQRGLKILLLRALVTFTFAAAIAVGGTASLNGPLGSWRSSFCFTE